LQKCVLLSLVKNSKNKFIAKNIISAERGGLINKFINSYNILTFIIWCLMVASIIKIACQFNSWSLEF